MSLVTAKDLVFLAKKNLGLRLAHDTKEVDRGGVGDAIPLSHLAGANDIITFITLSSLPELPREQMEVIYNRYKQSDIHLTDCMPRLILHYAARHNIGDAKERLSDKKNMDKTKGYIKLRAKDIESEVKELVLFYKQQKIVAPLEFVVERLPYLAKELSYHFNEKLQLRLAENWDFYAINDDMDYLFLTGSTEAAQYYQTGYDLNHYPLGKAGRHRFFSSNVVKQVMFLGGENRTLELKKTLEQRIFNAIKEILKDDLYRLLNQFQQRIKSTLAQHPDYPENFKQACYNMGVLVARLQDNNQLCAQESIDLLQKTQDLVDNPAEYKVFLAKAKNYRMVHGGRLAAYMMLIAGWAAKIVTANHVGNTWIKFANEKLDYLAIIEECADTSKAYLNRMK